jgi:Rrf2 family protein
MLDYLRASGRFMLEFANKRYFDPNILLMDTLTPCKTDVKVLNLFFPHAAMFSQTVEYSLRSAVALAQHYGEPCTAMKLSEVTEVPAPYLAKVLQGLVRAGLVTSRRGLHGGFMLAKSPRELTIWDIIQAVEPFQRIRECPLHIQSHRGGLCPLHRRLDDAMEIVESSFRRTTLADLVQAEEGRAPLCGKISLTPPNAEQSM